VYHSTCFGLSFCPLSGFQDFTRTYSFRYMSYRLVACLQAGTRWNYASRASLQTGNEPVWHIPEAVCTSKVLNSWSLKDRPSETCRVIFNKLESCAYYWFYYRKNTKCYFFEQSFLWYWKLCTLGSRSQVPKSSWNVVLEKDGKDNLDLSTEKWKRTTSCQRGQVRPTYSKTEKFFWGGRGE